MTEQSFVVLMAEDDEHDIVATRRAWKKGEIPYALHIVHDGEECLDYLFRQGRYTHPTHAPRPGLLLLDINMPRMSGLEVLRYLRESEHYKHLPVVMLTTSKTEEDRIRSYEIGANAFICKPVGFEQLSAVLRTTSDFWNLATHPGDKYDSNQDI
ncbi:response regulator [Sedimenticola sp.]|uniref:response regulator n=1 Tax=Sedimenticola sp. TaxID=1940285 RepID=UPI003D102191